MPVLRQRVPHREEDQSLYLSLRDARLFSPISTRLDESPRFILFVFETHYDTSRRAMASLGQFAEGFFRGVNSSRGPRSPVRFRSQRSLGVLLIEPCIRYFGAVFIPRAGFRTVLSRAVRRSDQSLSSVVSLMLFLNLPFSSSPSSACLFFPTIFLSRGSSR